MSRRSITIGVLCLVLIIILYPPIRKITQHIFKDGLRDSSGFTNDHSSTVTKERGVGTDPILIPISIQLESALDNLDIDKARSLLEKGANPNKNSPLSRVCGYKRGSTTRTIKMIDLLLAYGANINGDGNTVPLGQAAWHYQTRWDDHYEAIMNHLLENGADINGDGNTVPLIEAFKGGDRNSASFLLRKGAAVKITDVNGDTPYSVAPSNDYNGGRSSRQMLSSYASIRNRETQLQADKGWDVELSEEQRASADKIIERIKTYGQRMSDIASRADLTAGQIAQQLVDTRAAFQEFKESSEFIKARAELLEVYSKNYPLAQKILLRTVTKTTEDREELILNLAHATLSGGTTIAPTIGKKAIQASIEVLTEEGLLTEDEANALEIANTLIQTLDGAADADTVVKTAKAVSDSYKGLVECGVIDDKVRVRIKSGDRILDILIILEE